MASPNPKPSEKKKLQGTDRADRANDNRMEPMKLLNVPEPPEYLREHGRDLWNRQLKQLASLNMLTVVDLAALGRYCEAWDTWREAVDGMREHGIENEHGQVNAYYSNKKEANATMLKFEDRFGFVASAREKLSMPQQQEKDPLEEHLNKKTG